jgi:hypothetical protein
MVRNHTRVTEIQQKRRLFRGEAEEVLIVVVDDFHQVRKQHFSVVGQNPDPWMGKADFQASRCVVAASQGTGSGTPKPWRAAG